MRMSSMRGSAGAGSSINVTIVRSCWRSSGSGGKYPGTRTDLTNSPTICALGSMTRLPRRMRWPSRMRSASSSLSAVCDSSSLGGVAWSVMTFLRRALYCSSPPTTARAGSRMGAMTDTAKRNLVAQWAFDTRPVLLRFHLWLEDVEVERAQAEPVSAHTFAPRGIARCLAMTSAATALGTRLFGDYGGGARKDKATVNQVKKAADAVSAYVMSEGLWHLTRTLPENHALMVSLGEGLMPKVGETPEMGANPMLGFGRVYARPELAKTVDRRVRRLLNETGHTFEQFHEWLKSRGITLWGAAVDTLENTSRFADGQPTGPMAVFHLFDSPLRLSRPYESYMGCLTVPTRVAEAAESASVLLDYRTPRKQVVEAIEAAYPGIRRAHIHVWTLRGKSRVHRLGRLWEEWEKAGVHLVEDGWKAPSGLAVFTDSGTYAPTFLVGSWRDEAQALHVFLCDGYAATAEAMQAASLSDVLDVRSTMSLFSPTFELPVDVESRLMQLDPSAPDFAERLRTLHGGKDVEAGKVRTYAEAIREAAASNMPLGKLVLQADDFLPEKDWSVLASVGYMCDDPYKIGRASCRER